jgi:putative transcriptional regulator
VTARSKRKYYRDDEFLRMVGERIRELRKAKGLTQLELSVAIGDKDNSQIHRMEAGKVNFSVSYLSLIAKILEVSPEELLKPLDE